jgi:hypothetical protein
MDRLKPLPPRPKAAKRLTDKAEATWRLHEAVKRIGGQALADLTVNNQKGKKQ